MIIPKSSMPPELIAGSRVRKEIALGRAGGLSQMGVNLVLLDPGQASSDRHWHANSEEFVYILEGAATVVDDQGAHELTAGDGVVWPAGIENAHNLVNRSEALVRFLVVGTRPETDLVRYPDSAETLYHNPPDWKVVADDGSISRSGKLTDDNG